MKKDELHTLLASFATDLPATRLGDYQKAMSDIEKDYDAHLLADTNLSTLKTQYEALTKDHNQLKDTTLALFMSSPINGAKVDNSTTPDPEQDPKPDPTEVPIDSIINTILGKEGES